MHTLFYFIEPLGWALLHFLWQGAALALLLMAFLRLATRCAPQVRYTASGITLLLMLGAAAGTVWWQMHTAVGRDEIAAAPAARAPLGIAPDNVVAKAAPASETPALPRVFSTPPPSSAAESAAAPAPLEPEPVLSSLSLTDRLRPLLPWFVGIWAAGVVLFSLRLVNGWRLVRRWRASGGAGVPAEWTVRFAALCGRMHISRPVRLLSSALLTVPVVVGWLKPAVLVPAGLFSGIPAAQLEAILAHELAHIRRCDYLVNLLQTAVETVLFYHPAVWWVSAQLRNEREHCCDDAAASLDGDAIGYARALTVLEELRTVPAAAAGLSAAGGSLLQRIRRLAGLPRERAGVAWPLGILALAAFAASLTLLLPRSDAEELSEREKTAEAGEGLTPLEKEAPFSTGGISGAAKADSGSSSTTAPAKNPSEMGAARAPLEGELKKLAFGETHSSGLRAAWAFEPAQAEYALGSLINCRVVFHNNGKETLSFRTDAWHQNDTWIVKNGAGQEVKVKTAWYTGITPQKQVRLQPGEICEIPAHGVGIGEGKYEEAYSAGKIGAEIPAKEGDVLTCQWIVQLDHRQANPNWTPPPGHPPGTLTTGAIRFKVAAAGALIEPVTGVAKTTGKYDLAPGIKMQVTQVTSPAENGKTGYNNLAAIEWYDGNGNKALEWPIQLSAGPRLDTIVWRRGGTAIWIVRGLVVRKIDYTNAADLKETVIKMDEANHPGDAPPEVLQEIVRVVASEIERFETELDISVPKADSAENKDAVKSERVINVGDDGSIVWNEKQLTLDELSQKLTEIANANKKQAIVIRGDVKTPYEKIVTVLDAVHKAGLFHVSFATRKPTAEPEHKIPAPDDLKPKPGDRDGIGADGETTRRLALARGFLDAKDFAKARDEIDAILKLEPLHQEANRLRKEVIAKLAGENDPFSVPLDSAALAEARKKSISLTVMDSTGQKPLSEFRVIAGVPVSESIGNKDAVNWQPHTLHEGRNGGMMWPLDKAYDKMALRVEADGYVPQVYNWIEKKKGPQDLFFQMVATPGVQARVFTPDGKPAAGATIAIGMVQRDAVLEDGKLRSLGAALPEKPSDRWRLPRFFTTDAAGIATLPAENDPTAALLIVHDSGVLEMSFNHFAGSRDRGQANGPHDVKLVPWARIKGKVQWGDKAGSNQKIGLIIHRDKYGYPGVVAQYEKTVTAADGSFVFERILPGLVQLSCPMAADPDDKSGATDVNMTGRIVHATLQPGENPVVIGGTGRTIRGKLTGRDKWEGVTFHFHPTAPHIGFPGDDQMWKAWSEFQKRPEGPLFFRSDLEVKPDGTFEIPNVLPGDYQIFFTRKGESGHVASGKFTLEPETADNNKAPKDIDEIKAVPESTPPR